jgi:hypothetical protein
MHLTRVGRLVTVPPQRRPCQHPRIQPAIPIAQPLVYSRTNAPHRPISTLGVHPADAQKTLSGHHMIPDGLLGRDLILLSNESPVGDDRSFAMISPQFSNYAAQQNMNAQGGQNAQLRVVFLVMHNGASRREWLGTETFAGQGDHTERRLIQRFWADLAAMQRPVGAILRLVRVEVFTRFNTCLNCTDDLVNFRRNLAVRMTNVQQVQFDVADRGNVYLPFEGNNQISTTEGLYRREAASTALRLDGWIVTNSNLAPQDIATLGTVNDPIVLM